MSNTPRYLETYIWYPKVLINHSSVANVLGLFCDYARATAVATDILGPPGTIATEMVKQKAVPFWGDEGEPTYVELSKELTTV